MIYFVDFFTICCVIDSKSDPIQDGEQIFVPVKSPLLYRLMSYIGMFSICFLNKLRILLGSVLTLDGEDTTLPQNVAIQLHMNAVSHPRGTEVLILLTHN